MKRLKIAHIFFILSFSFVFLYFNFSVASAKENRIALLPRDFENQEAAVKDWLERAELKFEVMFLYLSSLENKIKTFTYLTEAERSNLLGQFNSYQNEIKENRVLMLSSTSVEDLESLGMEVEELWGRVRILSFQTHGEIILSRLDYVIENLKSLADSLERKSEGLNLEEKSAVDLYIQSIRTKIRQMEEKRELVSKKIDSISEEEMASIYFSQGKQYVRESKEIAGEIVSEMRKILFYME